MLTLQRALQRRIEGCECQGDHYGWGPCPQCAEDEAIILEQLAAPKNCPREIVERIRITAYRKWEDAGGRECTEQETERFWNEAEKEEINKLRAIITEIKNRASNKSK